MNIPIEQCSIICCHGIAEW